MKVGTDSLILGAWSQIDKLVDLVGSDKNLQAAANYKALDIGTGTGLLSLMLAQKTQHLTQIQLMIDAIELDANACIQAQLNSRQSPWSHRIHVYEQNFFKLSAVQTYDWAIANPPYFQSDNCENKQRQLARQLQGSSWADWFKQSAYLLKENAVLEMVIPTDIAANLITSAELYSLVLQAKLNIKTTPVKPAKRTCLRFKKQSENKTNILVQQQELIIYDRQSQYTPAYKKLLKDFYLKF